MSVKCISIERNNGEVYLPRSCKWVKTSDFLDACRKVHHDQVRHRVKHYG
jgi:hypothetical protein